MKWADQWQLFVQRLKEVEAKEGKLNIFQRQALMITMAEEGVFDE